MSKPEDFKIFNGILLQYLGTDAEVVIPDGVKSIANWAFDGCKNVTRVKIPDGVKSIGNNVFEGCVNLESIVIPDSVTSIGNGIFNDCTSLSSIKVGKGNAVYNSQRNCNAIIETSTNKLIVGCKNTVIPSSVTSINYCAFKGCLGLKSITIPKNIKKVGDYAFEECNNATIKCFANKISSAWFSSYTREFEGNCFFKNVRLSDVPKQLKTAAVRGFLEEYNHSALSKSMVSDYCAYIRRQKKKYLEDLKDSVNFYRFLIDQKIILLDEIDAITGYVDDIEIKTLFLEYKNSFGDKAKDRLEKKKEEELEVIMGLKNPTLADYKNLYRMEFEKVNNGYFFKRYRGNETKVIIPDAVGKHKVIGISENAFKNCKSLASIIIPDGVKSIGDCAFYYCTSLTNITIPEEVINLGSYVFGGCRNLTIHCHENSAAHKYALENNIIFELIEV